ncbi:hypothetical protein [Rickettsia bellii]|uniref:hypothetical protein n=1 Tax=Rickettsia bellii TaxID=33990 RepID=UPI0005F77610|nr:hypothetical protein [Rickettsia bellii]
MNQPCHSVAWELGTVKSILVLLTIFWIPWTSHGMTPRTFFDPCGQCRHGMTMAEVIMQQTIG